MKILTLLIIITLSACGSSGSTDKEDTQQVEAKFCPDYIMSGQSNSTGDYSHFTDITGYSLQQIGVGGYTILELINSFDSSAICTDNLKGILFVHGENDAFAKTPKDEYLSNVEKYRLMIKDVPMYITLVGHSTVESNDHLFDAMRDIQLNSKYSISYYDTDMFNEWGLLRDRIHFNQDGINLISEAFAEDIWDN